MEPDKEKWIKAVMGSLNGLQQAEPNPFLFAKIEQRLQPVRSVTYVPARLAWLAAASFLLLALLNGQLIRQQAGSDTNRLDNVVSEMQLFPTENQLYDEWNGQNY